MHYEVQNVSRLDSVHLMRIVESNADRYGDETVKLYYIADWVDYKCDLTLEKVAELCTVEEIKEAPKAL